MAKENDHIAQELAKIAASFSQAKSQPKTEVDIITQELDAIATQFTQKTKQVFPTTSHENKTFSNQGVMLDSLDTLDEANKITEGLESISFSEIIKDYISQDFPDCIQDIYGAKSCFILCQKLVNNWEEININGEDKNLRKIATNWSNLIPKTFAKQFLNSTITKLQFFETLNLPKLSELRLIAANNLGLTIHKQGKKLTQFNRDQWLIISNLTYEIIRIFVVEMIWKNSKNERNELQKFSNSQKTIVYTVKSLKQKFDSFQAAKEHFKISAQGWQKLADKLNEVT
jgi:hypothetical protein